MNEHRIITDQLGRQVLIPQQPKRIISLVPSQTELLFYLGLDEEVIGITKFCIHPVEQFPKKTKIGGTKQIKLEVIEQLQPDLIIANKEENEQLQIEALAKKYPVWISDISTLDDALAMISQLGHITNRMERAENLVEAITNAFANLNKPHLGPRIAYFIWRKPWMVAAGDTFIDQMLQKAGFDNVFGQLARYPEISAAQLAEVAPDVLLLSSEPYPFRNKHFKEFREVCPKAVIILVDGELFSWYGNRLLHSAAYFRNLRLQIMD